MNPEDAVDLGREALKACIMVGGPIVILGLVVGLAVGLLQAMTQVQDQTVSFVPKILVMIVGIGVALPWLSDKMIDYTKSSFESPMIFTSGVSGSEDDLPNWEPARYLPIETNDKSVPESSATDQTADRSSPAPPSTMPRLSQKYSMPTMKPTRPSSMPMLGSGDNINDPTSPRVAEKFNNEF